MDELIDSSPLLGDGAKLGEQLGEDGYLFLRGVLDRDDVLALRAKILAVIERYGWLKPGTATDDALAGPVRWTYNDDYKPAYHDLQHLEAVHRFSHHPRFFELFRSVLGDDAYPIPGNIVRIVYPGKTSLLVPPHPDFPTCQVPDMLTCWFPLGDVPREHGGLAVLPGSQVRPLGVDRPPFDPTEGWLTTDYRAGDVLINHCLTWHVGRPNTSDRIRLSMDTRWASASEALPHYMLAPDMTCPPWEELAKDWTTQAWREVPDAVKIVRDRRPHVGVYHPESRWVKLPADRAPIDTNYAKTGWIGSERPD